MGYFLDTVLFGVVYRCGTNLEQLEKNTKHYVKKHWPEQNIYVDVHSRNS